MLTRRRLLAGLCATACAPRRGPAPPPLPDGPVTLGWRMVPGLALGFRTVIRRVDAGGTSSRAEEWRYLVRGVDGDGIATLEGRLTGFGGGSDGKEAPRRLREAEQATVARPVALRLGMDGHLLSCSEEDFARALPHRMLGLRLPMGAARVHDTWSDTSLPRHFSQLLPLALEVELEGDARLLELHHDGRTPVAAIETRGLVRSPGGPSVVLTGTASWDAERGVLARRQVEARMLPPDPDPARDPGVLTLTLFVV